MTTEKSWTGRDGAHVFYRYDDCTDPWKNAPLVVLPHPELGSSLRLYGSEPHLARDYLVVRPDIRGNGKSGTGDASRLSHNRCVAHTPAFLTCHFPQEHTEDAMPFRPGAGRRRAREMRAHSRC
jgi:pimeloyl-ACP methyl ester carboxylesterase